LALALLGSLVLAAGASGFGEYEPNDAITQTAGPLQGDVDYEATQDTDNDVDYYRFYTSGQVQLRFRGIVTSDASDGWGGECGVELLDANGEYLNGDTFYVDEFDDMRQTLYRSGIYYLKIGCGDEDTGSRYRFSISPGSAIVNEACGVSLTGRETALDDQSDADRKVAKLKERLANTRGKRSRKRVKKKLRAAKGVLANSQKTLDTWNVAVAQNCA
jgi:hypothetical protein